MKKRIILCTMSIIFSLLCLVSCALSASMKAHDFDFEAIGELVQDYITEKYGIDCELTNGYSMFYAGDKYVEVKFKTSGDDNTYTVTVFPETDEDTDRDGYYDSYYIHSDTYMITIVQPLLTELMNDTLVSIGVENHTSSISNLQQIGIGRGSGFLSDFPIPTVDTISTQDFTSNYNYWFFYNIHMSESEYSEDLETVSEKAFSTLFRTRRFNHINIVFKVYSDDDFLQIIEEDKNNEFCANKYQTVYEFDFTIE